MHVSVPHMRTSIKKKRAWTECSWGDPCGKERKSRIRSRAPHRHRLRLPAGTKPLTLQPHLKDESQRLVSQSQLKDWLRLPLLQPMEVLSGHYTWRKNCEIWQVSSNLPVVQSWLFENNWLINTQNFFVLAFNTFLEKAELLRGLFL